MIGVSLYRIEITELKPVWVFPHDRFVEYGPEDERWARFFGFGHEEKRETKTIIPKGILLEAGPSGLTFRAVGGF